MIEELRERRLLSVVRNDSGLIGYRFAGALHEAFETLDTALVEVVGANTTATPHSCPTLIDREALSSIGFFEKLPCIPMAAVPHGGPPSTGSDGWLLSPSTCYHTFAHLAGSADLPDLGVFTARGTCHRFEPASAEPTRLASFTMRELVLIGGADEVLRQCEVMFERGVAFLRELAADVTVERASDVFYGERSEVTRKVQLARGVKKEVRIPWTDGAEVSVGSRNLHRDLFTTAFAIGSPDRGTSHSACVAFGIERLLLTLLAQTPGYDPDLLTSRILAAVATRTALIG
ncbi:hypothetical protein [Amycolatopsis sp. NPDC052450]|uniref:hypothetical protein n=1 Tax=Amycolatopsis sp. NPDC052450 TaxID=3363937 RepID=UPI0037C52730